MRSLIGAITLTAALGLTSGAQGFDESKYPNWKGMWDRGGIPPRWTPPGTTAPLTPEYQALYAKNTADQKAGGHGMEPSWKCLPPGMPRIMNVYEPMEVIITPATTYIVISHIQDNRRIYTDGRDWPKDPVPTFQGYSIGKWLDTDGDGRYDTLETETRRVREPHVWDQSGMPMAADDEGIIRER